MNFKYEKLTLFFLCGYLGHNGSFCLIRLNNKVEGMVFGWDLFLKAKFKKAMTMNSVWLREEGDGKWKVPISERLDLGRIFRDEMRSESGK